GKCSHESFCATCMAMYKCMSLFSKSALGKDEAMVVNSDESQVLRTKPRILSRMVFSRHWWKIEGPAPALVSGLSISEGGKDRLRLSLPPKSWFVGVHIQTERMKAAL